MKIKSKRFHYGDFDEQIEDWLIQNSIKKRDIISITTPIMYIIVWYWADK